MNKKTSQFAARCYEILKQVPHGKVTTYHEIARALNTRAWRAVGSVMARNENLIVIPCHRVVKSNGEIGQYALGSNKKSELLQKEGVPVINGRVRDLNKYMHRFANQK